MESDFLIVMRWKLLLFLLLITSGECNKTKRRHRTCGGILNETYGVIQTPNFPNPFPVPIKCTWVIDASHILSNNASIVVYLTQLYVLKGLTFTEYAYYDDRDKYGPKRIHEVTDRNVTELRWLQSHTPYLVVEFHMNVLEGNQFRALDNLLDVYGFNITYEISTRAEPVRNNSCIVVDCSFVGHCYASHDLASFWCSCFERFSGSNCGKGPLCEEGRSLCQNGATCSHVGAQAFRCHCPRGYTGEYCGFHTALDNPKDCGENGCLSQCPFDGQPENVCNCPRGSKIPTDISRYEGTVRLSNLATLREIGNNQGRSPVSIIERQLTRYLKNSEVSKVDDFKVLNIGAGAEVTFHFFGAKKDGNATRDALNQLIRRGKLGNLTFAQTLIAFREEPTLLLQSVKVNRPGIVREGDEFILSCTAQGSSHMTFRWYKDDIFVNVTKATRTIWSHLQTLGNRDQYMALLVVGTASPLDEGIYTCQVEDWGIQQCKSIHIKVRTPPVVKVFPRSLTVQKGANVSITCNAQNDGRPDKFGYNWIKNQELFPLNRETEVWEELYPAGSILKITNIQKSAVYTCKVSSPGFTPQPVDVRIEVLNKTIIPLCTQEKMMGVIWPETSPGVYSITQCPPRFVGDAKRLCVLRDVRQPEWDIPDFSSCVSESLVEIQNNFRRLTYGYQNTTGVKTLETYLDYLQTRTSFLPGEGERILNLVYEVISYINTTEATDETLLRNATRILYSIMDHILQQENSITDVGKVVQLQRMIRSQALLSGTLAKGPGLIHNSLQSLVVDVATVESSNPRNLEIPWRGNSYPQWFTDKLNIQIEPTGNELFSNGSFTVAVFSYKTLSNFLPQRASLKTKNGDDVEYEIASNILGVSVGRDGKHIHAPPGAIWLDLDIHHLIHNYSWEFWNTTCAVSDVAGSDNNWDMSSCITISYNSSLTKCTCSRTGTFVILLTTRPSYIIHTTARVYQLIVILGCTFCLVLAIIALSLLLLYWYYYRSVLVYLKIQCCLATIGSMSLFLYAIDCGEELPQFSYPYITTLLATFLLVGMSSHLSVVLIVYTELVHMSRIRRLKQTVVGIITGVPIITLFGNHLAHRSIGREIESWWLRTGTLVFQIFVTCAIVIVLLFIFLYLTVMRKLRILITKHEQNSKVLNKRVGLLWRTALLFFSMVFVEIASICFVNIPDNKTCHYVFAFSCSLFGFLLLVFYVVKCETSIRTHLVRKLKTDKNEEDFSSDSANSPLSFFTKQDPDAESESAPPRTSLRGKINSLESSEGLLLSDSQIKLRYAQSEGAPSTIETYLHSISEESVERYEIESRGDGREVDLELYNSSPKKYRKSPIDAALYSESENMYPEHWYVRGLPDNVLVKPSTGQFLRECPHPPDILTTRVCVELGLVPTSNPNLMGTEANILVEAPSLVLCSVDVEPCEIIELPTTDANIRLTTDSNTRLTDTRLITDLKEVEEVEIPVKKMIEPVESVLERKQPEGREKSCLVTESGDEDNLDGMLDRISHDLDYLLNRNTVPEIQVTPASSTTTSVHSGRKLSKPPASSIRGQIKEEDEEEETALDNDIGIAKTAC